MTGPGREDPGAPPSASAGGPPRPEEHFGRLFHQDITGDFISTPGGRFLACNAAFARIFGFESPEDALRVPAQRLYPEPGDRARLLDQLRRNGKLELHEIECRRADGTPVHLVENLIGIFDEGGELTEIQGFIWDNSERKRLEEQLRQARTMEAVGRLAAGIAHDFDNVLEVIMGYGRLLRAAVAPDPAQLENADALLEAVERGTGLTQQLLAFSRRRELNPRPVDLNRLVLDMAGFLRRILGPDTPLELRLDPDLPPVKADPSQLEQVVLNLVVNGREAMPEGGSLRIETGRSPGDPGVLGPASRFAGSQVRLSVADTGVGMDAETQSRIFEPFFTSREDGTGLGLAIVYRIVTQSGGFVEVESAPGAGTVMHVSLPPLGAGAPSPEPPGAEARSADAPAAVAPGGDEERTVLVVEDEVPLRILLGKVLEGAGIRVRTASRGVEAVRVFQEDGSIRVLLTDLELPDMNGGELALRLRTLRPGLRVLFMSGAPPESLNGVPGLEEASFLAKPFGPEAAVTRVRSLLDRHEDEGVEP